MSAVEWVVLASGLILVMLESCGLRWVALGDSGYIGRARNVNGTYEENLLALL